MGFAKLATEVTIGKTRVVLGIAMCRLAPTGREWHQLRAEVGRLLAHPPHGTARRWLDWQRYKLAQPGITSAPASPVTPRSPSLNSEWPAAYEAFSCHTFRLRIDGQ
jgi:hypothetical protein